MLPDACLSVGGTCQNACSIQVLLQHAGPKLKRCLCRIYQYINISITFLLFFGSLQLFSNSFNMFSFVFICFPLRSFPTCSSARVFRQLKLLAEETLISIRTVKALAWERLSFEKLLQAKNGELYNARFIVAPGMKPGLLKSRNNILNGIDSQNGRSKFKPRESDGQSLGLWGCHLLRWLMKGN